MLQTTKTFLKIGEMVIDPRQIFWRREYVFASIPLVQLLQGHIILCPIRKTLNYKDLQIPEITDLGLTTAFLVKSLEQLYGCTSTTIHFQNSVKNSTLGQFLVHIIPRRHGDLIVNDDIYKLLDDHPLELIKQYEERLAPGLPGSEKYLEGIEKQTKQLEEFLDMKCKEHHGM